MDVAVLTTHSTSPALFVWVLVTMAAPERFVGQTYTCLTDTAEDAQVLHNAVVSIVTDTDAQAVLTRNAYHLPAVNASKVSVVTAASVSARAGDAYHAAVTLPGTPPVSRTLVVIKVAARDMWCST